MIDLDCHLLLLASIRWASRLGKPMGDEMLVHEMALKSWLRDGSWRFPFRRA
jgi:hypothetical protein